MQTVKELNYILVWINKFLNSLFISLGIVVVLF